MKTRNYSFIFLTLFTLQFQSFGQTCVSPLKKVVYYDTLTGSGNSTSTVSFPKFDPSGGTLTQINISLDISILYNFQLENGESISINNYRVRVTRDDEISSPALMNNIFNTYSKTYGRYTLAANDGVAGSGSDYISVGPTYVMNRQIITQSVYNTADFMGTGTVDFDYTNTTYSSVLGSVNYNYNAYASDTVIFKVEYISCPTWFLKAALGNFQAQLVDNRKVHLLWSSRNEEAGRNYQLQYSYDGRTYTTVHERNSQPVENKEIAYQYDHYLPDNYKGKSILYRIKVVEADGKETYSETRVVALKNVGTAAIALMPNPAQEQVQVVFNSPARSNWQIGLYSPNGLLIKSFSVNNASGAMLSDLKQLQRGVYTLRCTDLKTKMTYSERLILQ